MLLQLPISFSVSHWKEKTFSPLNHFYSSMIPGTAKVRVRGLEGESVCTCVHGCVCVCECVFVCVCVLVCMGVCVCVCECVSTSVHAGVCVKESE